MSESTEGWRRKDAGTSLNPLCDKTQAPQGRNSGHPKLKGDPLGYGERILGGWSQGPSGLFLAPRMEANRIAGLCSEEGTSVRKLLPLIGALLQDSNGPCCFLCGGRQEHRSVWSSQRVCSAPAWPPWVCGAVEAHAGLVTSNFRDASSKIKKRERKKEKKRNLE